MRAARNITLCTKDCACLFVCPTGATDTEDGQIDGDLCLDGCRLCVDACPSHAIYLVYDRLPRHSGSTGEVADALLEVLDGNAGAAHAAGPSGAAVLRALAGSNRILAEDCIRELGGMVPDASLLRELAQSGVPKGEDDVAILRSMADALDRGLDIDTP